MRAFLFLTISALALGAGAAQAQTQLTPLTLASGGGRGVGTTVVLTCTIGQPFAASLPNAGATFLLTQGFQQPLLNGAARPAPTAQPTRAVGALLLEAWPTPTADFLHLTVRGSAVGAEMLPATLSATLTDALGRAVLTQAVRPAAGLTTLDLRALPVGCYVLLIIDDTGRHCAAARVIRQ